MHLILANGVAAETMTLVHEALNLVLSLPLSRGPALAPAPATLADGLISDPVARLDADLNSVASSIQLVDMLLLSEPDRGQPHPELPMP